jgi:flavin reductase (DIM6/NTAB) family NADH-FMN oxidoreductase RutF
VEGLLEKLEPFEMIINPSEREPGDVYRILTGAVIPRPIAFVSSMSASRVRNLAPFSFFTVASGNPPVVCFAPIMRAADGMLKDTLRNVRATGEFVVNIVSEDFAQQMNICSTDFPPDVDEFSESGLTPVPSDLVAPPRVRESRVAMECKLHQIVEVSALPLGGSLVMGLVLRIHIQDDVFIGNRIDPDRLKAFGRLGGQTYARTTDRFEMPRPSAPKRV